MAAGADKPTKTSRRGADGDDVIQERATPLAASFRCAASLFCKRWTPLIVRLLLERPHRFSELLHGLERASDRMLSERLKELEAFGLVDRQVVRGAPLGVRYSLTPAGRQLGPVVAALQAFSEQTVPSLPGVATSATSRPGGPGGLAEAD